ncbi:hypothetical protein HZC08_02425 [Candidatus Micrarchaeota archaeon]|nr:hypothetical protein [Candidatus Micrarchaeota archaeon]
MTKLARAYVFYKSNSGTTRDISRGLKPFEMYLQDKLVYHSQPQLTSVARSDIHKLKGGTMNTTSSASVKLLKANRILNYFRTALRYLTAVAGPTLIPFLLSPILSSTTQVALASVGMLISLTASPLIAIVWDYTKRSKAETDFIEALKELRKLGKV